MNSTMNQTRSHRRLPRWAALLTGFVLAATLVAPASPATALDTGVVEGTVTFVPGGAAVEGTYVQLVDDAGQEVANTNTDAAGFYQFLSVAEGDYKVCLIQGWLATPVHANVCWDYKPWRTSSDTFVSASDTVVKDIQVVEGATLSGTVTGADGPSANWWVSLDILHDIGFGTWVYSHSAPVQIAGDGTWSYSNLLPGQYELRYFDYDPTTGYRTQYHDQTTFSVWLERVVLGDGDSRAVTAQMSVVGPVAVRRIAGADRYATAVAVSQEFDPLLDDPDSFVYIAAGGDYPDALAAAALAADRGAPLLLTPSNSLPSTVQAEIVRLNPRTIIIAGGTGVVSSAVEAQLVPLATNVIRLGGADRYATARLLVDNAYPTGFDGAFIATGRNYADALAAAATAGGLGWPVILVDGSAPALTSAQMSWLDASGVIDIYIAGGTGVVTAGIEAQLQADFGASGTVTRKGGADRYETSLLINEVGIKNNVVAFFATGAGFADALAGAALAGSRRAALFSVPPTCVPSGVLAALPSGGLDVDEVVLFGGTGVLSGRVFDLTQC